MKAETKRSLGQFIITVLLAALFLTEITKAQHIGKEKTALKQEYAALEEDVSRWKDSVYNAHEWFIAGLIDSANLDLAYGRISKDEHTVRMQEIAEISDHVEKEPPYIVSKRQRMEEIENELKKLEDRRNF